MSSLRCVGSSPLHLCALALAVLFTVTSLGCGAHRQLQSTQSPAQAQTASDSSQDSELAQQARAQFGVLPTVPKLDAAWVQLGRRLFFERRVSADAEVGCVTCHSAEHWGADGLPRSKGVWGRDNPRNAPTVFNAAYQQSEHWYADRTSVEDQARRALFGKGSFGLASDAEAVGRISAIDGMVEAFRQAFPDAAEPVSVAHWGTAIGAYERTLRTASPFDAFMAGDASALSAQAKRGLRTFIDTGCPQCHDGPLLGGNALRKFGVYADYATLTHSDPVDLGRFEVTHNDADRYVFKVPQLRGVAKTAPYFHDGSVAALPDAVKIMAKLQLDEDLSQPEVEAIVAFLETLTGPVPDTFSAPEAVDAR